MTRISDLNRNQDLTDGDLFPIGSSSGSTRSITAADAAKYFSAKTEEDIAPLIDEATQAAASASESAESAAHSANSSLSNSREALRRSYAEAGLTLVPGSFEIGGTVNDITDVLLHEATGKAYSSIGSLPFTAAPDSSPDANWIDRSPALLSIMIPITHPMLAGGAVSGQDSTSAVEAAGSVGGTYYVPKGEYIISSAKITKSTVFVFEEGASFKRAPGLDVRQSYWNDGVPMIDAAVDGLTIMFVDPVFDGNKANQPAVQVGYSGLDATTEPSGWAFRYYPRNAATAKSCRFVFVRPEFKNGTSGYILVRGDDVNRRFKTEVFLDAPIFTDTIYGYGKGDPATPSALGYSPDYIQVIDYVTVNGRDVDMSYSAVPTPTGRYAPVGIRATYIGGGTPSAAGGPSVNLFGQTTIRGMGRKGNYYDDSSFLNNGIGAIDGYGNADSIYVENIIADDCEAQPVRAKASISRFEVNAAKIKNCRGGVQVSPSTTGETEAIVVIGTVEAEGGWNPAVEVVGTDGAQLIPSASIGTVNCRGGVNGDGRADNTVAGIFVRYCDEVYAEKLVAKDQDKSGIQFRDNQFVKVNSYRAENTVLEGFTSVSTVRSLVVSSGQSKSCGGIGLTVTGATYNVKLADVYTDGTKDYGVFVNAPAENCEIDHCTAREVSGLSRGFHLAGPGTISNSKVGSGVTTPASGNLFTINQINNSWSPRSNLINAGAGAPTLGDFRRGDRIYSAPSAGGYVGWVCTVAGVAGSTAVFKRFGAIEV